MNLRKRWRKLLCRIFGHKHPSPMFMAQSAMIWGAVQEQGNEWLLRKKSHPVLICCERCGEVLTVIA